MKKILLFVSVTTIVLASCQKEIDWGLGLDSDADLLIKAVEITPSTNDTNIVTFQWDGSRRLLKYESKGEVNNTPTDISHVISRAGDGKITKIISKSSLTAGFLDSTVYFPFYQTGTNKLNYVIDSQYTVIGTIMDSTKYTYQGNQLKFKEIFSDFLGTMTQMSKQTYTYDGTGNITMIHDSIPDGMGGYDLGSITTYSYDSHRTQVQLGEESYIVIGPNNVGKGNATKVVVDASASGGPVITTTGSQYTFNAADRPLKYNLSITPQPPGYDVKLTLYYQ